MFKKKSIFLLILFLLFNTSLFSASETIEPIKVDWEFKGATGKLTELSSKRLSSL